jgi:hypothetical protein
MLAADLAMALDPVELFRAAFGAEPDAWQIQLLRSRSPRILLNCSRQAGKSTATGVIAVHEASFHAGSLILLLSPALRQSQELFRKCLDVYRALDNPVPAHAESALRLELENGSRIVSLPGKEGTIRGYSGVRLLAIDEAARVPDELYASVRPMLATSGGRLIAPSTPWGRRGWWHREYTEGGAVWERFEVPATECPRIPAAFLEEERQSMSAWQFAQEYMCQFEQNEATLFSHETIRAALDPAVKPLWG